MRLVVCPSLQNGGNGGRVLQVCLLSFESFIDALGAGSHSILLLAGPCGTRGAGEGHRSAGGRSRSGLGDVEAFQV